MKFKLLIVAAALCGLVLVTGCSKTPAKATASPAKLELVAKDATKAVTVTVMDSKGQPIPQEKLKEKKWDSANADIAEVDATGLVKAKASGKTSVTFSVGTVSATVDVTVKIIDKIELTGPDAGFAGIVNSKIPLKIRVLNEKREEIPSDGIKLTSSDPKVATVDDKGEVTLVSTGNATIAAALGNAKCEIPASVLIQVPAAVKITKNSMVIKRGESATPDYTVLDTKGVTMNFTPVFSTSNDKVATVDEKGAVTGVAPGTAKIAITAGQASNSVQVSVR